MLGAARAVVDKKAANAATLGAANCARVRRA